MTLIQTFFSSDFVIQVSDRRLTGAGGYIIDDDYTKLVFWNGSFTAGSTGVDPGQTKSTSVWIAEVLSGYPVFGHGVNALRTEAEAAIQKLPNHWNKRLAIVVAGFDQNIGLQCAEIANFDTKTGFSNEPKYVRAQRLYHARRTQDRIAHGGGRSDPATDEGPEAVSAPHRRSG